MESDVSGNMPDTFDLMLGNLHGLPDVVHTKPTTIRTVTPLVGRSEVWIIQTYRQREKGDTIFLERVTDNQAIRIALPAKVADLIARQREALTDKARSKAAKTAAQERKDRGELPGFMKPRKVDPQSKVG